MGNGTQVATAPQAGSRTRISLTGVVQGVGFRPFVYRLAQEHRLRGLVRNCPDGVIIEIEGSRRAVRRFSRDLVLRAPPLARIRGVRLVEGLPPAMFQGFEIVPSESGRPWSLFVPPDVALCSHCRSEVGSAEDRRCGYPFTNCTDCGPRFTIIRSLPYDRETTTMAGFEMCELCRSEYYDPASRRFHAEPNACASCGPRALLLDRNGRPVYRDWREAIKEFWRDGVVLAVKSLGGFHLACNARDEEAVCRLRARKSRPHKPLAVMFSDLASTRKHCLIGPEEEALINSPQAPIVILRRRADSSLPEAIAPGTDTIGAMLPYTPLHLLLFDETQEALVMTSGNLTGLPIAAGEAEAIRQLGGVADYFLVHDRPIHQRCDDSVVRVLSSGRQFIRRSRGYVPSPVAVPPLGACSSETPVGSSAESLIFGAGAEMKNAFCVLNGDRAIMGPHVGEMEFAETEASYLGALANLQALLGLPRRFDGVGYDAHPDYRSGALARALPADVHVPVQHHHAHMASCMAENGLEGAVLGVVCDGTGYGADGHLWGFEVLCGDYGAARRVVHLRYTPQPGGEAAVKKPVSMAAAFVAGALGTDGLAWLKARFPRFAAEIQVAGRLAGSRDPVNTPLTSSCGRLFDAVAALSGVCLENTYEGQAAAELCACVEGPGPEYAATGPPESFEGLSRYPFGLHGGVLDPRGSVRGVVQDVRFGLSVREIALRFHNTVASMVVAGVLYAERRHHLRRVVLSGGSFQNPYLLSLVAARLGRGNFEVYTHREVPPNDGGIALGQAMVARSVLHDARRCLAGGGRHWPASSPETYPRGLAERESLAVGKALVPSGSVLN